MRIPHCLLLAFASSPVLAIGTDAPSVEYNALNIAESKYSDVADLSGKYAAPGPQCGTWVGIEKIFMAKRNEISPDESTVTETLTRSICATATTSLPCYPCIMSTAPWPDTALTVTVTSCSAATEETLTVTIQLCSTCDTSVYTGTVPGYTPGGPCHGCTPYATTTVTTTATATATILSSGIGIGSSSPSPCTETDSDVAETTTTTTSTSTSTVSGSDCDDEGTGTDTGTDTSTSTSTPPGNPGLPASSATTTAVGTGTGTGTGTTAATHTSSKPATAAPPVVTAGGVRSGGVVDVAGMVMGLAVVGVVRLGM